MLISVMHNYETILHSSWNGLIRGPFSLDGMATPQEQNSTEPAQQAALALPGPSDFPPRALGQRHGDDVFASQTRWKKRSDGS